MIARFCFIVAPCLLQERQSGTLTETKLIVKKARMLSASIRIGPEPRVDAIAPRGRQGTGLPVEAYYEG